MYWREKKQKSFFNYVFLFEIDDVVTIINVFLDVNFEVRYRQLGCLPVLLSLLHENTSGVLLTPLLQVLKIVAKQGKKQIQGL